MIAPCHEQFQFGDGNVVASFKKYLHPCFLDGVYRGTMNQASVPVQCPQLLSKALMKTWNTDLCFGESMMKIHKFDYHKPFNKQDVPMVNIFEVTPHQVYANWHLIPKHFKNSDTPPTSRSSRPTSSISNSKLSPSSTSSNVERYRGRYW